MEPPTHDHPACLAPEKLLEQCSVVRGRGSGPGGQHRNKVETGIVLTHDPSGIRARAGERRSQAQNQRKALFRLRLALAVGVRAEAPVGAPSVLWRSRCSGGHVSVNPRHRDFPCLLAEALDTLAECGFEPRPAAVRLGCTPSQLVKLAKDHPPAFVEWTRQRSLRHRHPLR